LQGKGSKVTEYTLDRRQSLYEVRTRKILTYSNVLATGSNVIYVALFKDLTRLDVGGMLVTLYRLIAMKILLCAKNRGGTLLKQTNVPPLCNFNKKIKFPLDKRLFRRLPPKSSRSASGFTIRLPGASKPRSMTLSCTALSNPSSLGEISPEDANRLGYELAMKFTGGRHQFVVSTHVDKLHIHTHVEFNSTNLDCDGKFQNVRNSAFILRQLNDELCRAHGLSVIENPKPSAKKQKEMAAARYGTCHKEQLRQTIDRVLPDCHGYDDFLAKMRSEGYEIKEGKLLSFRAPGWDRFTRSSKLGSDYTKQALQERSANRGGRSTARKKPVQSTDRKINLLIDIQAKLAAGKGAGYERWAKIFNLKEAAKTLSFLVETGLTDYDELAARAQLAGEGFDEASRRIKQLEARMAEIAQLKTHIINYSKTREVYTAYRKSRHKKEFLAKHGAEIAQHEAAKKAFDALGGKPIPRVAQLSQEYAALLAEKRELYVRFRILRKDMIAYRTAKQNVDRILGLVPEEQNRQKEQKPER